MSAELVLIALAAGATVMLTTLGVMRMVLAPRVLAQERIAAMRAQTPYVAVTPIVPVGRRRPFRAIEEILRSGSWSASTHRRLEQAGLPLQVGEYFILRLFAVVLGVALSAFTGGRMGLAPLWCGLLGLVIGLALPPLYLQHRIAARMRALEPQLVELCEMMASMLRSGFGYMQALTATTDQLAPPLSRELERMVDRIRLGAGMDEALEQLNQRLGSRDFDMIATAIAIQRRSGGSLANLLAGVAETIRERQMLELEVRALTSRERMSALVVAGFPLVLVGVLTAMMPATFGRLFTDPVGHIILVIALSLDAVGYVVIKRVTKITI